LGNWLSVRQAQTLLNTPDATTAKGLRDRAILAVLLGCGLRRSEVAALTVGQGASRSRFMICVSRARTSLRWNTLWEMLPNRQRAGNGWEPGPPLILAAWGDTPGLLKHMRFLEHLEWTHTHGCIDQVDAYLRALPETDWFHFGD
jgi:integrase